MKTIMLAVGILVTLIGLLWIGQGSSYFPYPQSSFMVSQTQWVYYGALLGIAGLVLIAFSRR